MIIYVYIYVIHKYVNRKYFQRKKCQEKRAPIEKDVKEKLGQEKEAPIEKKWKNMKHMKKILQENRREEKEFSENEMSRLRTWISKSRQGKDFPQDWDVRGRDVKKVDTNKSFGNEVVTLGSCRLPLFY